MKKTSRILCGALAGIAALSGVMTMGCSGKKLKNVVDFVLEVERGRDVRILQLTDIQIIDSSQMRYEDRLHHDPVKEEGWAPDKVNERAFNYMRQAVAEVKPDLIVLSGDNIYGEFDDSGSMLQTLIAEMESYETPWTMTFGNHDLESRKGVEWVCSQYEQAPHCLFKRGPVTTGENGERELAADGNCNFNIGITQGGKLTEVVWLMDSNGNTEQNVAENKYKTQGVRPNQIEWFTAQNEALKAYNGGKTVKSIGFFHHPTRALAEACLKYGYVSARNKFGNYTEESFQPVTVPLNNAAGDMGAMRSDAENYIDTDFELHALLKKYGCEGWFFGHEHSNDISVVYDGIRYTYGVKASEYDTHPVVGYTDIRVGKNKLAVKQVYLQTF